MRHLQTPEKKLNDIDKEGKDKVESVKNTLK
jgi:hypothetical protein